MPNGRIMVNSGGASGASDVLDGSIDPRDSSNGTWAHNPTIKALSKALPGQVSFVLLKEYN